MIKTNEILRQYYLNLFTSSAEITKNGDKNYIYKWNIRDLQLNNAEIGLIQIANNKINLTEERPYPPKLYNTFTEGTELIYMDQNPVYYETITLDTDGITYGSGTYEIYYSSILSVSRIKNLFNLVLNDSLPHFGTRFLQPSGEYNYPTFSNKIIDGYYGDWIIIKLPTEIILTNYKIYPRLDFIMRAPALWRVYGSIDGLTYVEIKDASNDINGLTSNSYINGPFEKVVNSKEKIPYSYIGFTVNKLVGGSTSATLLNFCELQLFGREPINDKIIIRTLNVYNDGYDSQNQGAILYIGNDFKIKPPTYHKLISNNLNSISLTMTDDINIYNNGIRSDIDLGLILHIKDYKNQADNNL